MQCPRREDTEQADDASCVYSGPLHSPSLLEKYQPEACGSSMNTPGPSPHRPWQGLNGLPLDNHQPVLAATLSCPERVKHEPGNDTVEGSGNMSIQGLPYPGSVVMGPGHQPFTVPAPYCAPPSYMTPAYSRETTSGFATATQPGAPVQNLPGSSSNSIGDSRLEPGGKWVVIPDAVRHRRGLSLKGIDFTAPDSAPHGDEEHERKAFVAHYCDTRRDLGFMQQDVCEQLEAMCGFRCSQSKLSVYERHEMRPHKAKEMQVVLKAWLESDFVKDRRKQLAETASLCRPQVKLEARHRRFLELFFDDNPNPEDSVIARIAKDVCRDEEWVRMWFETSRAQAAKQIAYKHNSLI